MSQARQTQQARQGRATGGPSPLALVSDEQVLRCHDRRTGWQWFFDVHEGEVVRYHEVDNYAGVTVPETIAAETLALANVEWYSVSRVYLEVWRGDA